MLKRPIRLAIVGVRWPPETFIARKIAGLAAYGVDVTVFTSGVPSDGIGPEISVITLPSLRHKKAALKACLSLLVSKPRFTQRALQAVSLRESDSWNKLNSFLRLLAFANRQFDIIHFEWNSAAIEFEPLFDLLDSIFVISCRGAQVQVAPHNPDRRKLADGLRRTFIRANAVHCVSEAILQEAAKYGLDRRKAHVIRPAVDVDFFQPRHARSSSGPIQLVTTGSLIWRKGHEYALQAINLLKDRHIDVRFTIIGDGPERQRVLYTIQDLGLEKEVQLVGSVPPAHVRDLLQQADIFLLSSLSEDISNAVLEAMACGLPVVTTDCGGMREAVTDGIEGFTVPVRDPETMAAALAKLARDPELRSRMGRAARDRILKQFTLAQQTAAFIELYQSLMKVPKHN